MRKEKKGTITVKYDHAGSPDGAGHLVYTARVVLGCFKDGNDVWQEISRSATGATPTAALTNLKTLVCDEIEEKLKEDLDEYQKCGKHKR